MGFFLTVGQEAVTVAITSEAEWRALEELLFMFIPHAAPACKKGCFNL